ncbi:Sac2 family-domain-containing protein [Dipodascopsis uninucleata]
MQIWNSARRSNQRQPAEQGRASSSSPLPRQANQNSQNRNEQDQQSSQNVLGALRSHLLSSLPSSRTSDDQSTRPAFIVGTETTDSARISPSVSVASLPASILISNQGIRDGGKSRTDMSSTSLPPKPSRPTGVSARANGKPSFRSPSVEMTPTSNSVVPTQIASTVNVENRTSSSTPRLDPMLSVRRILDSDSGYIDTNSKEIKNYIKSRTSSSSTSDEIQLVNKSIDDLLKDESFRSEIDRESVDDIEISDYLLKLEAMANEEDKEMNLIQYEEEIEKFKDLHVSIQKCDTVLKSVEEYLSRFQDDLGLLSNEIETLQNLSIFLNRRLENRKQVESRLSALIEDLFVPPQMIRIILSGNIDSDFIMTIQTLTTRLKRMELFKVEIGSMPQSVHSIKLIGEIDPILQMLSSKAIERIRDFFVQKIKGLRIPNINAQVVQYSVLLKYRQLYAFLAYANPKLADEIAHGYINTMKWYYTSNFNRYIKALECIRIHRVDRTYLLGSDSFRPTSAMNRAQVAEDPMILGRRVNIIFSTDSSVIMENMAEKATETYWIEVIFRSLCVTLMDNVSAEYLFIADFFVNKSAELHSQLFNQIFENSFASCKQYVSQLIETASYDAFGVLLCIRITQLLEFELQRRKIPVMESFCNGLLMLLWPRFQNILEAHAESMRKLVSRLSGFFDSEGVSTASAIGNSITSMLSSTTITSTMPHVVTQKFALFLNGILELSPEDVEAEPVWSSIVRLRSEFEVVLTKLSSKVEANNAGTTSVMASAGSLNHSNNSSNSRERFLYNNYMLVLTIISDTEGKLADQERLHFQNLTDAYKETT